MPSFFRSSASSWPMRRYRTKSIRRGQLMPSAYATASFSAPLFRISTPLPSSKTISARLQGPTATCVSGWTSNAREMSRWAASQFPDPQTRSSSFGIIGTAMVKPCAQTTITLTAALNSTRPQRKQSRFTGISRSISLVSRPPGRSPGSGPELCSVHARRMPSVRTSRNAWSRIRQCLETEGPDGERLRRGIQIAARKSVLLQAIDEGASAESQPARSLRLVSGDRGKGAGNDASFEGFDLLAQAKAGIEGRLGRLVRGIGRGASRERLGADLAAPALQRDQPRDRVLQLPDVARPVRPAQRLDQRG